MKTFLATILTLVTLTTQSQYTYFESVNTLVNQASVITHIHVLNDTTYLCLEHAGPQLFYSRIYDSSGVPIDEHQIVSDGTTTFWAQMNQSLIKLGSGELFWAGSSGDGSSQAVINIGELGSIEAITGWCADSVGVCEYKVPVETVSGDLVIFGEVAIDNDEDPFVDEINLIAVNSASDGTVIEGSVIELYEDELIAVNHAFQEPDGSFLIWGMVYGNGYSDPFVCRLDEECSQVVQELRWGTDELHSGQPWVVKNSDGQYAVMDREPSTPESTYHSPRFNYFDPVLWELSQVSTHPQVESQLTVSKIVHSLENGYYVAGDFADLDLGVGHMRGFVMKLNEYGDQIWYNEYVVVEPESGDQFILDRITDIQTTLDGGVIVGGAHQNFNTGDPQQSWLLKLDGCGDEEWLGCEPIVNVREEAKTMFVSVWPNPTSNYLVLECLDLQTARIYATDAKLVYEEQNANRHSQVSLDVSVLAPGVYVLTCVNSSGFEKSMKFVKE